MANLQGVLANIPGLAGYLAAQQNDQQQQMGQLQQIGGLQAIVARAQAQAQADEIRGALASARTPEERLAVAERFAGPKDILAHADRQATAANTKELALARLKQAATQGDQMFQLRAQSAKDARERAAVENEWKTFRANVERERLKYDTGTSVPSFQLPPMQTGAAPAAAAGPGVDFNLGGVRGTVPTEADAMAIARQMGFGGGAPQAAPVQPSAPVAAPAPVQAPVAAAAPNNLDARDLRMANAPAAAIPAPAAPAPVAPPQMPQFSGSPRERAAAENRWRLEQAKTSIAGSGRLTPEALTMVAEQYLSGDRQAIQGYARDQATKSALQNKITELAKARGWDGKDIAAQMADFAGIMSGSRTVGQRAANIELAATEAEKMMKVAEDLSKGFDRTNFPPINMALKAFETNTGQPEVRAFGASINTLVNIYARAISPTGVPTVSDKEHARELLNVVDSPQAFAAVLEVMREEMKAAKAAPGDVRAATRRSVTGRGDAASAEATTPTWDDAKERRYQELLRKRGGT